MNFVVLDLETTGLQGPDKGGRIIEIGAVKVENFQIVDRFSTFVNPEIKIPKKIVEITRITDDMVKDSPTIWNIIHEFWDFIKGYTVVAHNATFDWDKYLKFYFKKIGKHTTNDVVCTVNKSKEIFGLKKQLDNGETIKVSHKLIDLCERMDVKLEGAHRAVNDCNALAQCFIKMYYSYPEYFQDIKNLKGVTLDKKYNNQIEYKVHSVNYWEEVFDLGKKNQRRMRRFYVMLAPENMMEAQKCYPGTVFFDIERKSWGNKDFLYNTDYELIEELVLKHEKVDTLKSLYNKLRPEYIRQKKLFLEKKGI